MQIPILSTIILIAWAVGADIYVKDLDAAYLKSLNEIKEVLSRWYPGFSFSTTIHAKNIIANNFSNQGYGLLFSGGLDSTASYVGHKEEKPNLIMVWGIDIPLTEVDFWHKVKKKYKTFADQENVEINFIKTNLREAINEGNLSVDFYRPLYNRSWWTGIHFGIGTLSLCAPLTFVKNIRTLWVAATQCRKYEYPRHAHPAVDNKLSWGDLQIVHDNFDLTRHEKVRNILKPWIATTSPNLTLRVCYSQFHDFNCNKCEKCRRTITSLVLENIDPTKFGFRVALNFFDSLKRQLIINKDRLLSAGINSDYWKDVQIHIPTVITHNLHSSRDFFRWFKDFGNKHKAFRLKRINLHYHLSRIYCKFPKTARPALARLEPIVEFLMSVFKI
ncbi:MAG: hypothetical protein ACFFBD_23185 [Candidatus Hodarchaeota archaeon]